MSKLPPLSVGSRNAERSDLSPAKKSGPSAQDVDLHSRFKVYTPRVRSRSFHVLGGKEGGKEGAGVAVQSERNLLSESKPGGTLGGGLHAIDVREHSDRSSFRSEEADESDSSDSEGDQDHLSLLDPYFDLTTSRLKKIFFLFDQDDDGVVSYESFRRGLSAMGIGTEDDDSFRALIRNVDTDNSGGITYQEFESAVQMIKMADLFKQETIEQMTDNYSIPLSPIYVVDYSPEKIRFQDNVRDLRRFFFSPLPSWTTVRWVNMEGIDPLNLKRLAIRYRLHPLAVEDVLKDERQRPKFEIYEDHNFLVVPLLKMGKRSHGQPFLGTIKKEMSHRGGSKKSLSTRHPFTEFHEEFQGDKEPALDFVVQMSQVSLFMLPKMVVTVTDEEDPVLRIGMHKRLDTTYAKVRQNDVQFLIYAILDTLVDELVPIVVAFQVAVTKMERELHSLRRIEDFKLNRVQSLKRQLVQVHRAIKPMREVVRNLIEDEVFNKHVTMYMRDVHDHLVQMLEDAEYVIENCRNISEEFHNLRSQRQNEVMYILTLVTTMFIPAQFLTGVYGMNFDNMPELHYEYAYYVWWVIVLCFFLSLFFYFRLVKRWI